MQRYNQSVARTDIVKRILIYGISTLLLGVAQAAFFPLVSICPTTPDLLIGMLTAIALLDGAPATFVMAVAAGFFIDSISASAILISPIIYFCAAIIAVFFAQKVMRRFASFLLLLIPTLILRAVATYISALISLGELPPSWVFSQIIFPEAICTAIFAIPTYFILKLCTRSLEEHGKFSF